MKPLRTAVLTTILAVVIGFYVLCGYIVHETGSTAGLPDLGEAVARLIEALPGG